MDTKLFFWVKLSTIKISVLDIFMERKFTNCKVEAPEGAPATYTNYWGYEIDLLYSIGKGRPSIPKFPKGGGGSFPI